MSRATVLDFDAADVELQVAAYKVAPAAIVQNWAVFGLRHHRRIRITAVRIVGTCAICGRRDPVSACTECDRDACADDIFEAGGRSICWGCALVQ